MSKKKRKVSGKKVLRFVLLLLLVLVVILGVFLFDKKDVSNVKKNINQDILMESFVDKDYSELEVFCNKYQIEIKKEEKYSFVESGRIISQSIKEGSVIHKKDSISVVVSKGEVPASVYQDNHVNELGSVPIMMYHGIHHMSNSETNNTGGNVDKDGYNRTTEAFRGDLEFYYRSNYRMIRLNDYINGDIDVELGKSPIILTFDDGKENNFKVLGEENGELKIDPNCAVGILEEFKKKYPDYHVTATFFVNSSIFDQEEYNEKILKWLVSHGYDVGNHTMTHPDFTKIDSERALREVGGLYQILERIIPGKYVPIIAMPFGSPYKKTHPNFDIMMHGTYEGLNYQTKSMLRVGWEGEVSPFDKDFDPTFLKRIRAYDNNGVEFDIEMNFKILEKSKYISDGDKDVVVIHESDKNRVNTNKKIRTY